VRFPESWSSTSLAKRRLQKRWGEVSLDKAYALIEGHPPARPFGRQVLRSFGFARGFRQRARTPTNRLNFNVWTTKKRVEKLRYMHRNPVKRGLVAAPEQWRWSSYRFYLLQEIGPVRVNEGWGKISFQPRVA
jgi:hypothetical protein